MGYEGNNVRGQIKRCEFSITGRDQIYKRLGEDGRPLQARWGQEKEGSRGWAAVKEGHSG